MENQRSQAEFFGRQIGDVRTIYTAAHPDDAVMFLALPMLPYPAYEAPNFPLPSLVGVPARQNIVMKIVAIVTPATLIECDIGVSRVHDAVRADHVFARLHCILFFVQLSRTSTLSIP